MEAGAVEAVAAQAGHNEAGAVEAGALESHWNALSDDEDFKREVNLDPSVFRIRSSLFHNHGHHS